MQPDHTPEPSLLAAPLEIHDLTVSYHNKPVLWGIDLVVPRGQLIGIIGPNGAGDAVNKSRPTGIKGIYLKKVSVSSTMGVGVRVEQGSMQG